VTSFTSSGRSGATWSSPPRSSSPALPCSLHPRCHHGARGDLLHLRDQGLTVGPEGALVVEVTCPTCPGPLKWPVGGICNRCYLRNRYKKMPAAQCHPERKEHCAGLCRSCYRDGGRATRATCHPDRFQAAHGLCTKCYNDLPESKARNVRARRLRKYNLTQAAYDALLAGQGWVCAICGGEPTAVDHNHQTGTVRGLLCHTCNTGLGHFQDNPGLLERAVRYLREDGSTNGT
jgi:hypothetical protein